MGGGGKKGSAPAAPDYQALAELQGRINKQAWNDQNLANHANQYGPGGSSTWSQLPNGQWTQQVSLNPQQQANYDMQQANIDDYARMGSGLISGAEQGLATHGLDPTQQMGQSVDPGQLQSGLDFGGAPGMPDPQAMNQRGIDAAYNQYASRLDPRFAQQGEQLRSQLYNQGLREGDAAYDQAMANFGRERNDAYQTAANNAVGQGAQIGNQLFGQGLAARQQGVGELTTQGQFANQAAGQQFGQDLAASQYDTAKNAQQFGQNMGARNSYLQQALAAFGGPQQSGLPQLPSAPMSGGYQGAPVFQAGGQQYQSALDAYNAENASWNNFWSGLAGGGTTLGSAAILKYSDVRLKFDIVRLPHDTIPGVPWATWRWLHDGSPGFGVIAQDLERVAPQYVVTLPSGLKLVNYSFLG